MESTQIPELKQPFDSELLKRCADFVRGWHGVTHGSLLKQQVEIPTEASIQITEMYNSLHGRTEISEEYVAVIGLRAIYSSAEGAV